MTTGILSKLCVSLWNKRVLKFTRHPCRRRNKGQRKDITFQTTAPKNKIFQIQKKQNKSHTSPRIIPSRPANVTAWGSRKVLSEADGAEVSWQTNCVVCLCFLWVDTRGQKAAVSSQGRLKTPGTRNQSLLRCLLFLAILSKLGNPTYLNASWTTVVNKLLLNERAGDHGSSPIKKHWHFRKQ